MEPELCFDCAGITLDALCGPDGYRHLQNAQTISASAARCPLCDLIWKGMNQNRTESSTVDRAPRIAEFVGPKPLTLFGVPIQPPSDSDVAEPQRVDPLMLIGIDAHIPLPSGDDRDIVNLSLFAKHGSKAEASQTVLGRPLLQDAGSEEAFNLLQGWHQTCVANHSECRRLFSTLDMPASDEVSRLPTRVLDVGPPDGSAEPRLYIPDPSSSAGYAALSHCWGKTQILTTRRGNINHHREHVPFSALSRTFQDAVIVTRRLGLRYLWIDSLCIVQDDAADWQRESMKMGRIYQDAAITIAATGAKDGTGGCFIPRSTPWPQVALPCWVNGSPVLGESVYVTLFPDEDVTSLTKAPLGGRAWITQEWMLSRRTIHYTRARMIWACRSALEAEDRDAVAQMDEQWLIKMAGSFKAAKGRLVQGAAPESSDLEDTVDFIANWNALVSTYTSRDLTFASDKPVAIIGLASEIQRGIGETYTAGLFHHGAESWAAATTTPEPASRLATTEIQLLMMQLLWFPKVTVTRPSVLQDQPSWAWTSTMGAIWFHGPVQTSKPLVDSIRVHPGPSPAPPPETAPHITSTTPYIAASWLVVLGGAKVKPLGVTSHGFSSPYQSGAAFVDLFRFQSRSMYLVGGAAVSSQRVLHITDADANPVGWVVFDLGAVPPPAQALYVARVSENEIADRFDGFNVMFLAESAGSADGDSDRRGFTRVGVGEILMAGWFDSVEAEDVFLF